MDLGKAGLISGLGAGLGKGLEQMQSGIIQQGLLSQRFEHDDAAANVEREFQMRKLKDQQGHELALSQQKMGADIALHTGDRVAAAEQTDKKIAADRGMGQEKIGADIVIHRGDQAAQADEKAKDRTLKREELAEQREYHKGLNARIATRKPSLPPEKQAQLDVLKERSKELEKQIEKFSEMGSKAMDELKADEFYSKSEEAMAEQNRVHEAMEKLVGVDIPKAPATGSGIKDRFSTQSPLTKGK